jgi:alkylation response protein AidB-like acyl-CoA dehydrogenase
MTSTTDERAALADAVAGLLADHDPVDSLSAVVDGPTGYRTETWRLLAEQGLLGLLVPESLGGSGGCHGDIVVVCTQMGGVLLPGPFISGAVAATSALVGVCEMTGAPSSAPEELLGDLVAGRRTAALVDGNQLTSTGSAEQGYVLSGTVRRAVGAATADAFVVAVGTGDEVALTVVERSAVEVTEVRLADATRRAADLRFDDLVIPPAAVVASGEDAAAVLRWTELRTRLALAADSAGGARAALHLATSYARTRVQFGRTIGSFQAIKHKLASMYVAVQSSAAVVAEAADLLDAQAPGVHLPGPVVRTVTAAAAHCTSSYVSVAGDAIQTHGGIGFTWEHPCHRYFKRAWLNQTWLGGEAAMHLTVADLLTEDAGLPQPDDGAPADGRTAWSAV